MLPYQQQRLPIAFERSNIEMGNIETHRTLLPINLEEIADMIEISEREPQTTLYNIGKIDMRLSKNRSRINTMLHQTRREKGNIETPTIPSHHHIIALQ